jgi:hypothetical protein
VISSNSGQIIIEYRNVHATLTRTLTFWRTGTVDGDAPPNKVLTVPANQTVDQVIGPFDPAVYGTVLQIDVSTVDIQLRAVQLGSKS